MKKKANFVFVTGNQNKLAEIKAILGLDIKGIELPLDEIQEMDTRKIIKAKALSAFERIKEPVLVEDTSLEITAWKGLPGPLIKWFLERVGVAGLCRMMKSEPDRSARAVTIFGLYDGRQFREFKGMVEGRICLNPEPNSGFGWDPIFIPRGLNLSFAKMGIREKNRISHRRKALDKLKKFLWKRN